jgi:hypothetical protein
MVKIKVKSKWKGEKWKGILIEESLDDNRYINNIEVLYAKVTHEDNPKDRWHIYYSFLFIDEIAKMHAHLKKGWFMHFWKGNKLIVLFKDKKFLLNLKDKSSWEEAIKYGLSQGIPKKQLDFQALF